MADLLVLVTENEWRGSVGVALGPRRAVPLDDPALVEAVAKAIQTWRTAAPIEDLIPGDEKVAPVALRALADHLRGSE